jgi:hypothetical protein
MCDVKHMKWTGSSCKNYVLEDGSGKPTHCWVFPYSRSLTPPGPYVRVTTLLDQNSGPFSRFWPVTSRF